MPNSIVTTELCKAKQRLLRIWYSFPPSSPWKRTIAIANLKLLQKYREKND